MIFHFQVLSPKRVRKTVTKKIKHFLLLHQLGEFPLAMLAAPRRLAVVTLLAAAGGLAYSSKLELNVGVVLPYSSWRRREYMNHIRTAVNSIRKTKASFSFMDKYQLTTTGVHMDMLKLSASPTSKLE